MSDEHGHGPSNDKPMLAGLAVVAALGIALGVGRVDPYAPAEIDEGAHQELRVGDVSLRGEVHGHGDVLQVHTAEGVVFVPRKKAVVTNRRVFYEPDDRAHPEGESVSGKPSRSPLDQLALRAFSRRNSRLYGEALPLYAELVTQGLKVGDPRTQGWAQTLGETVNEYCRSWAEQADALERARRVREVLENLPGARSRVWLTDAYATLLEYELLKEHPEHHEALGELLEAMGPEQSMHHADVLRQLENRLHPPHEGGGILVPKPPGR